MRTRTIVLAVFAAMLLGPGTARACDEYKTIQMDELKDYRDKLTEVGADPLDQLFAFQQMVCSDSPTIRAYAIKAGLEGSTDPILRQEIMLDAMMDKSRIDIELSAGSASTPADKAVIKRFGGLYTASVEFRSVPDGCISLRSQETCYTNLGLFIKGDKVEFEDSNQDLVGQFQLTDSNELVGFVRYDNGDDYGRIQAVIKLF